jgi:uncharacterized protein (TIGR02448 family)
MKLLVLSFIIFGSISAHATDDSYNPFVGTTMTLVTPFFSTLLTMGKTSKIIQEAQDDAQIFVASQGRIRGAYLDHALAEIRKNYPALQASDIDLASQILAGTF